ncbi:MAG: glycogen synthase GlgA [Peptococcia bacterium]
MKILFVAAEAAPFCKTGGLGDVIGSLPIALQDENHQVAVVLPLYQDIAPNFREEMELIAEFTVPVSWRGQYCGLKRLVHKGVTFYFIDNEYYFGRPGFYGYYDEAERFAYFNRAVLQALPYLEHWPQILHCHDWQAGLIGVFKQAFYWYDPRYQETKIVFTIHNLKYQVVFSEAILGDVLGLGQEYYTPERLEYNGAVSFMKAAIIYSDWLTTVSRSYAEEIKNSYYGEGMDPLLRKYEGKLSGIVNGIDYNEYNPLTDPALEVNYRSSLSKKAQNKSKLQKYMGINVEPDTPLLGLVSRLVEQKGLDLLIHIMDELLQHDLQLVVLGSGESKYEDTMRFFAAKYPDKLGIFLGFSEELARKIYAGSDLYLMPSKFEPCGISQLIAMRYGSVPVVRETGGLKDTVQPYNEFTGEGNGFGFKNYNAHELLFTVQKALKYYKKPEIWKNIVRNCLKSDFSWKRSAQEYSNLYHNLL